MYLILNRLLLYFGLRIVNNEKIVFLYRIRDYSSPDHKEVGKVIKLTDDITQAFGFLKLDYADYKKQQFKTIFDFTTWVVDNCKYITVDFIKSLEDEIKKVPETDKTEIWNMASRFVNTIKVGHIILRDFKFLPIIMYPNLKESIVRNYFDSEKVQNEFVDLKLRYLKEVELQNKFSPKAVINWIKPLKHKPELTGIFTVSFVNYITGNDTKLFPRFLIDTDAIIVKKEVISYYYNLFPNTVAFEEYALKHPDIEEVVK
jgi:hypothetical protein